MQITKKLTISSNYRILVIKKVSSWYKVNKTSKITYVAFYVLILVLVSVFVTFDTRL